MVIYIVTKSGRTLTDIAIQRVLEQLAFSTGRKKIDYIYRCGPSVNNPISLLKQIHNITDDYQILYYESFKYWKILNDDELRKLFDVVALVDGKKESGELLAEIVTIEV